MTTIANNPFSALGGQQGGLAAQSAYEEDFNQFLQMLTVQLQNQDPTSPMDTNQFTQQLVMFSQVEQQMAQNANLERLIALQSVGQIAAATSLVGQRVEVPGVQTRVTEGDGATWRYGLPTASAETVITVRDATGGTVLRTTGATEAGRHEFAWNGRDADGEPVPAGTYSIQVRADDADGEPVIATVSAFDRVDGLTSDTGQIMLDIDGRDVRFEDVRSVRADA